MKYKILNDEKWLYQKYIEEKLSIKDISKVVGCSRDAVRVALLRNKIELRTSFDSNAERIKRNGHSSKKYELLNNEKWLQQKYVEEKLSTIKIAKLVGAKTQNSVRQALIRANIAVRSVAEGLTCNRVDDGFQIKDNVLNGCLLGDAGLEKNNKNSDGSLPSFYKKNKFFDHIEFVGLELMGNIWINRYRKEYRLINGKNLLYHRIDSLSHKELLPIYKKWYPIQNNFKKVVPKDIEIDETVLLHWWLDDGSSSYRKDRPSIRSVFCSESFSLDDQEFLKETVNSKYNLDLTIRKYTEGSGFRIHIKSSKICDFLDLIGSCPVPNLEYKWKVPKK